MTEDEEKILCQKYPKIFKNREESVMEVCMDWGFECGSGWFNIIDTLCQEIQYHIDQKVVGLRQDDRMSIQVIAGQIKQKYGGLRFYYTGGDDTVSALVSFAENLSNKTCEHCGQVGKKRNASYIEVLCDECVKGVK